MSRRYNPEESRQLIIDSAEALFLKKGFEKVSMQDLARASGLSKGAIYHHFDSKEEIIRVVMEAYCLHTRDKILSVLKNPKMKDARSKLQFLLSQILSAREERLKHRDVQAVRSPDMLYSHLQNNIEIDALIVAQVIEEGLADGSMQVKYPLECAEMFLVLIHTWLDTSILPCTGEKMKRKLLSLQELMRSMGCDIIEDSMIERIQIFCTDTDESG